MVAVLLVLFSCRDRPGSRGLVAVDKKLSNRNATREPPLNAGHPAENRYFAANRDVLLGACAKVCYANLPSMEQLSFRPLRFQAMLASTCSQTSREDNRISRVRERRGPLIPVSEGRSANKMLRSQKGKRLGARSSVATATEGA